MIGSGNTFMRQVSNASECAKVINNVVSATTRTTLPSYPSSEVSDSSSVATTNELRLEACDSELGSPRTPEVSECANPELQEVIQAMGKKELRDLDFPFLMADPSRPGCPLVVSSAGFSCLTGYDTCETLGSDAASMLPGRETAELMRFASRSELFPPGFSSLAEDVELADGELVTVQTHAKKCGSRFSCITYMKQVELDDEMFVIAVQAEALPEDDEDDDVEPMDRLEATFSQLQRNMEVVMFVLAAQFWFCAPIQRQIADPALER
jgi:hypothetical protein